MRRYSPFLVAALGLAAFNARAASLSELMRAVPPPPADTRTAVSWVKGGEIVAPEYTQFKQALEAERSAVAALGGTAAAAPPAVSGDAPEVQGAAAAYARYLSENSDKAAPAAALTKRTRWIQSAVGTKLRTVMEHMAPCPAPCADATKVSQNQPLMAKKQQIADEDIKYWGILFKDWQRSRGQLVDAAQAQIAATGEGAKATTPAGKLAVAQYRAAMLKEIDSALSITELAVKRADAIENGGVDSISGSTKTAAKK